MSQEKDDAQWSYFKACIGESYTPVVYGFHEATHPTRVAEVLAEFQGTAAADVIASLVKDIEIRRQREARLYAEHVAKRQCDSVVGVDPLPCPLTGCGNAPVQS